MSSSRSNNTSRTTARLSPERWPEPTSAWQALGIALAGDGFLDQIKVLFASGDNKGIREQVRLFLQFNPLSLEGSPGGFRKACLDELKRLRMSGLLSCQGLSAGEVARQAASFQRYADLPAMIAGAQQSMFQAADLLPPDCLNLARFLRMPTPGGPPLLVAAFAYFFRREIEKDQALAHGLFLDSLQKLAASQAMAFDEINKALSTLGGQFDAVLDQLGRVEAVVVETQAIAVETQAAVLDLHTTVQQLGGLHLANAEEVRSLLVQVQHHLSLAGMQRGEVRHQHSLSICGEEERRAVKALLARFRQLPADEQRQVPALLNGLGKLQVGIGDFEQAKQTFGEVAQNQDDPAAKAEAAFNAYRVALEQRKWDEALEAIRQAASLAPQRFTPFPMQRYQPRRILGAGGFGTAFLCHDRNFGEDVVVKTLHADGLERSMEDVFREARALRTLSHSAIIGVHECEYADPAARSRPYLVMDYFPGLSMEQFVRDGGPLSTDDLVEVARQVAAGMQTAHGKGILHRDLKPDNILVRKEADSWQVKIIDFGLALRRETIDTSAARAEGEETILGQSVAGTVLYAPPEQLGRLPGIKPGAYSDVYAFGKTCCHALFRTTEPKSRHWAGIPKGLAEILERCTEQELEQRCQNFGTVLNALEGLTAKPPVISPAPVPVTLSREDDLAAQLEGTVQSVSQAHDGARQLAEQQQDYALAVKTLEAVPEHLRDRVLYEKLCEKRDQVALLDQEVREAVQQGRVAGLQFMVASLLELQPGREDLRRILERLPRVPRPGETLTIDLGQIKTGGFLGFGKKMVDVVMTFAWIPAGVFLMGSPPHEEGRQDDEGPQHRVTLTKGFWLGIYPVTEIQWRAIMNGKVGPGAELLCGGDNCPVRDASWARSHAFCKGLGEKMGKHFRLPTEPEWEYACRAGTTTAYCFGDNPAPLAEYAWYRENVSRNDRESHLAASMKKYHLGQKKPNDWGLHEMHGNVWEWCQDWYQPYLESAQKNPVGDQGVEGHVLRGGSACYGREDCRSARRIGAKESDWLAYDTPRYGYGGYRHCATVFYTGCRVCMCQD